MINIDFQFVFVKPNSKQLDHFRNLVEDGKIRVEVNEVYKLEEASHTTGKIVIVP